MEAVPALGAMSVREFCDRHNISRQTFYTLLREDAAPQIMRVRGRTLISDEAASAWRERMTELTAQRRESERSQSLQYAR